MSPYSSFFPPALKEKTANVFDKGEEAQAKTFPPDCNNSNTFFKTLFDFFSGKKSTWEMRIEQKPALISLLIDLPVANILL